MAERFRRFVRTRFSLPSFVSVFLLVTEYSAVLSVPQVLSGTAPQRRVAGWGEQEWKNALTSWGAQAGDSWVVGVGTNHDSVFVSQPSLPISGRFLRAPHSRTASLSTLRVGNPDQNMRRNFVAVACSRAVAGEGSDGMDDETRCESVSVLESTVRPCRWSYRAQRIASARWYTGIPSSHCAIA
jgi:hypothetical protein